VSVKIDLKNLEWGERVIERAGEEKHGRRRSTRRHGIRRASIALNFTAMIDVVFLLLLYFMLTADFARQEDAFALDLPGPGQSERVDDPFALPEQPVLVRVRSLGDGEREYTLATDSPLLGEAGTYDRLTLELERALGGLLAPDHEMVIAPEEGTRWEHTLGAYNAVTRAGFERVRFARPRAE
jgi:biopolymer transport protein ExbD